MTHTDLNLSKQALSRLTLGTVALGMDYGISNREGAPAEREASAVVDMALRSGINAIDTARHYGHAEEVLGRYLKQHPSVSPMLITKFRIGNENLGNCQSAKDEVYESIRLSCVALQLDRIPLALFHKRPDQPVNRILDVLPRVIEALVADGLIGAGGVSAYHPDEVERYLPLNEVKAIQLPVNVFDQRLLQAGTMDKLADGGKIVFARSVFLQGLFFLSPEALAGTVRAAAPYLATLSALAKENGIGLAQLAFSYVRDMKGIDSIVFGAVNTQQVAENIELLQSPPLPLSLRAAIEKAFAEVPEEVITPGLWKP